MTYGALPVYNEGIQMYTNTWQRKEGTDMGRIALSDGEWKVMNALWKQPPKTIMQLTKELKEETDW